MTRRNRLAALARAGLRTAIDPTVATAIAMAVAGLALHACGIDVSPRVEPLALIGHMVLWLLASAIILVAIFAASAPIAMKGE